MSVGTFFLRAVALAAPYRRHIALIVLALILDVAFQILLPLSFQ